MSRIEIIQQPEFISDDDIAALLHDAHQSTKEKGMNFTASYFTGEQNRKRLGEDGVFYVALAEAAPAAGQGQSEAVPAASQEPAEAAPAAKDKELAGVLAVCYEKDCKLWCHQGKDFAELKMMGVSTKFKGQGISSKLNDVVIKDAFERTDLITFNTAEHNQRVIDFYERRGFVKVNYRSYRSTNYYSVELAKWRDGCPYSAFTCKLRYALIRLKVRLFYKETGGRRF